MSEIRTLKFPGDDAPREIVDAKAREDISKLSEEIANVADEVDALAALSECGIITPAYQDGTFYTDVNGAIYIL